MSLQTLFLISEKHVLVERVMFPKSNSFYLTGLFKVLFEIWLIYCACVHGSTNGTNGRPISFKVLPMVPLVIPLVPMVPLVKTDGSQYCRQSTVCAKVPTLESHMIKYDILNFKFINFTNKHCFYQDDIRK